MFFIFSSKIIIEVIIIKFNEVGNSGIHVSEMTLGCMSLDSDNVKSNRIIDYALDNGVNYLDTADLYQFGLNESMISRLIKEKKNNIVLTSKVVIQLDRKSTHL